MKKLSTTDPKRLTITAFKQKEKLPVIIMLDNVRSAHNVGSIFRTADAFLVEKIILGGITATPANREVQKTALGATNSVEWEHNNALSEKIKQLKKEGYTVIGIEQTTESIFLNDYNFKAKNKYVFIFGNEVNGVSNELLELSDFCIEIPQLGTKHSFNIAVSAGIVLWDFYSKLKL